MKRYVKNTDKYDNITFDEKAIKKAYSKVKSKAKHPTSINLPNEVISELKLFAMELSIPYQSLMRKLIIDGLKKMNKKNKAA
jgi:hypothetical protein